MRTHLLMTAAAVALLLAGCGDTKLLGSRRPPDETAVIDGPTLALPPDFDLHPPSKSEDYEQVLRAQKTAEAHALITGVSGTVPVSATVAGDDQWLTEQAGVADANIRSELDADAAAEAKAEDKPSFWQRIMGKKSGDKN
jgi:hypothetical protein